MAPRAEQDPDEVAMATAGDDSEMEHFTDYELHRPWLVWLSS